MSFLSAVKSRVRQASPAIERFAQREMNKAVKVTAVVRDLAAHGVDNGQALVNRAVDSTQHATAAALDRTERVANRAIDSSQQAVDRAIDATQRFADTFVDGPLPFSSAIDAAQRLGAKVVDTAQRNGAVAIDAAQAQTSKVTDAAQQQANAAVDTTQAAVAREAREAQQAAVRGLHLVGSAARPVLLPALERLQDQLVQEPANQQFDGALVGAGGKTYPAGTPLSEVSGVLPNNGKTPTETIIYVNGISTQKQSQARDLQKFANATGARMVGVHNATEGFWADGAQVFTDKLSGSNPAVSSLASTVYTELKAGRPVHLMAHSQGGLITSRALSEVKARLISQDGLSQAEAEAVLSKVTCETFAAAARTYPDGPKYTHLVNRLDVVPGVLGLGPGLLGTGVDSHPGRGAVVRYFTGNLGGHGVMDEYLPHRVAP